MAKRGVWQGLYGQYNNSGVINKSMMPRCLMFGQFPSESKIEYVGKKYPFTIQIYFSLSKYSSLLKWTNYLSDMMPFIVGELPIQSPSCSYLRPR